MKRILVILYFLTVAFLGVAQNVCEQIVAYTDKDCYLVGERLCVRVDARLDGKPSPSRVAYVEISDTRMMHAQCMLMLRDGQGWGEIALPAHMHSGCYQLTAYTKLGLGQEGKDEQVFHTLIGVINGEKLSRYDDISFVPAVVTQSVPAACAADGAAADGVAAVATAADVADALLVRGQSYAPGAMMTLDLPEADELGCALTLCCAGMEVDMDAREYEESKGGCQPNQATQPASEPEGHIVRARVADGVTAEVAQTRLALIGKGSSLYDGVRQADGSYLYYTDGISGNLPVLINAFDPNGYPVPMTLVSPYAAQLPSALPRLMVSCDEEYLLERANMARQQAAINQQLGTDTLQHSIGFMSATPQFFYDLDEYTQMKDVRELLLEFVRGIKRQKHQGINMLYTLDKESGRYARWPALVLLDGMPVYDIDEILQYDAHMIRFVQIYSGLFSFGSSCCQGVISFITRGGRLSNYKLGSGEHLMSYAFPQDHPAFVCYFANGCGTLSWIPCVKTPRVQIAVPSTPGRYQLIMQGRDAAGTVFRKVRTFEVRGTDA